MTDEMLRQRESLEELIEELKAVRDSVEELYILLDHAWRNRQELFDALQPASQFSEAPETIACTSCDTGSPASLSEALVAGWDQLKAADGPDWNYLGICPDCQLKEQKTSQSANSAKSQKPSTLF